MPTGHSDSDDFRMALFAAVAAVTATSNFAAAPGTNPPVCGFAPFRHSSAMTAAIASSSMEAATAFFSLVRALRSPATEGVRGRYAEPHKG